MKQRCTNCKKLLAIGTGNFAIKCPRCKTLNQINTKTPECPEHHNLNQNKETYECSKQSPTNPPPVNGLCKGLDETNVAQARAAGNAVCPQVAQWIAT